MTLSEQVASGAVQLIDHSEIWVATERFVGRPLESGDVATLTAETLSRVGKARLLLPDASVLIQRIVVGLLQGHVVLSGPPGTGKTTLAKLVTEAFNCNWSMVTATADWSAYDVIGGLQPKMVGPRDMANEVLQPWLGHVPRAAVDCADAMARHDEDAGKSPSQAHWLIIDEFNRADIDKAIGPLYTALGGEPEIPLWFGDSPDRRAVFLPGRFRIIGTINSVDTAYVFTFSQGLTRRFHFINVGVPSEAQLDDEIRAAAQQAVEWYAREYGGTMPASIEDEAQKLITVGPTAEAIQLMRECVSFVRYPDTSTSRPGWPLGTAQIVDVLKEMVLRTSSGSPDDPVAAVDLAVADRVVPQMAGLLNDQLQAFEERLSGADFAMLEETKLALRQLRAAQSTVFS